MDWANKGQPFIDIPAKEAIDLKTMDWTEKAQPFIRNYLEAPISQPPIYQPNKRAFSGYHCFMEQYIKNAQAGVNKYKLPDGTTW